MLTAESFYEGRRNPNPERNGGNRLCARLRLPMGTPIVDASSGGEEQANRHHKESVQRFPGEIALTLLTLRMCWVEVCLLTGGPEAAQELLTFVTRQMQEIINGAAAGKDQKL